MSIVFTCVASRHTSLAQESAHASRGTGGDGLFYCFAMPPTDMAISPSGWGTLKHWFGLD